MKFGLSDSQYEILLSLVIRPLQNLGAKVFIFGSRARGKNHLFSDIDLLFQESPSRAIASESISKILEDIENSNFAIKVDLVNEKHLATSYRDKVFSEKILIEN